MNYLPNNVLKIISKDEVVDEKAVDKISGGFKLNERFVGQRPRLLATSSIEIVGRFEANSLWSFV